MNRRDFIRNLSLGGVAALVLPRIAQAKAPNYVMGIDQGRESGDQNGYSSLPRVRFKIHASAPDAASMLPVGQAIHQRLIDNGLIEEFHLGLIYPGVTQPDTAAPDLHLSKDPGYGYSVTYEGVFRMPVGTKSGISFKSWNAAVDGLGQVTSVVVAATGFDSLPDVNAVEIQYASGFDVSGTDLYTKPIKGGTFSYHDQTSSWSYKGTLVRPRFGYPTSIEILDTTKNIVGFSLHAPARR